MVRAYYKSGFGLTGCYLDDSQGGARVYTTRRELADAIRYELEAYEMPKACFAEVGIRRLWRAIVNAKSASSYTFHMGIIYLTPRARRGRYLPNETLHTCSHREI